MISTVLSPPEVETFSMHEALLAHLQLHAQGYDYAIVVGRSWQNKKNIINKWSLICAKGCKPRDRIRDRKKRVY